MASPTAAELEEESFPVGYRFCPTNEELILYYLMKQQTNKPLIKSVHEVDFYLSNPWTLQSLYSMKRVKKTYFITDGNRPKPSGRGERIGEGYWKAARNYENITNGGVCRSYVYYKFRSGQRPQKTNWIMNEYRIGQSGNQKRVIEIEDMRLDGQVLCVLYESKRSHNVISRESRDTEPLSLLENVDQQDQGGSLDEQEADSFSEQHGNKDQLTTLNEPLQLPQLRSCLLGAEDNEVIGITSCNNYRDCWTETTELNPPVPPLPPVSIYHGSSYFEDGLVGDTQKDYQGPNEDTEMSESKLEEESLPIGVRFKPADEEIILYYLMNEPCKSPLAKVVTMVDFYDYDPWTLKSMYAMSRVKESYFLTRRTKKYVGGYRPARKAGQGYWKAISPDHLIVNESGKPVGGVHKTLVYYKAGKPRQKTNWIMKEYRLGEPGEKSLIHEKNSGSHNLHGMTLCKLYETKSTNKPSGFNVEEEGGGVQEWNEGDDKLEDMDERYEPVLQPEKNLSTIYDGIGTTSADLNPNHVDGYHVSPLREASFPIDVQQLGVLGVQQASFLNRGDNYNGMLDVTEFDCLHYIQDESKLLSSDFLESGFMKIPAEVDCEHAQQMYYEDGGDHINGVPSGTVSQDLFGLADRVTKPQPQQHLE